MNRFDFLHDGIPDTLDRLRTLRLSRRLRGVAATYIALLLVVCALYGLEAARAHAAGELEARAQQRFELSRAALSGAQLEWQRVEAMVLTDRRIERARRSGETLAIRLSRIGNVVPRGAWLDEIEPNAGALLVRGQAIDLAAVDRVLGNLVANPMLGAAHLVSLTRLPRVAATPIVRFEVQLDGRS